MRKYDFIIFGATGCTGRYIVLNLRKYDKNINFKWAIAGRSKEKLMHMKKQCYEKSGKSKKFLT